MRIYASEFVAESFLKEYKALPRSEGSTKRYRKTRKYLDVVCAFDIETSYIQEIEQSIMYIWQFQIGKNLTVFGRTWEEYINFVNEIDKYLPLGVYLVVYVHNLSYEFQFLSGIFRLLPEDVFAVKSRRPLKVTSECMEYRCSYLHTNMSLEKFLSNMNVSHLKLNYDYDKRRYFYTQLTEEELDYCANDVQGLVEAIYIEMEKDGDNLYTIPLTSTGYVRRDSRNAMEPYLAAHELPLPSVDVYKLLRQAFRGGNTHANRYYVGAVLENVHSLDRSSSYPDTQCNHLYPITDFTKYDGVCNEKEIERLMKHGKALLIQATLYNVELRDKRWGFPYIAKDKCSQLSDDAVIDNGRVLSAEYATVVITDVDYDILTSEYEFVLEVEIIYTSTYGLLPLPLIKVIESYYISKTELKGIPEQFYFYMKSKNKLNSIYGMTAQDPVRDEWLYEDGEFVINKADIERQLEKNARNAFISYAWGVWCTAWARWELECGLWLVHDSPDADPIYSDTDSIKYLGEVDIFDYNERCKKASTKSGAFATDKKGVTHYMGVYEDDGFYKLFRTWGAKKYAYTELPRHAPKMQKFVLGKRHVSRETLRKGLRCSPVHITVAGVPKKKGAQELAEMGGIWAFAPGITFRAGKLETVYNDNPPMASYKTEDGIEIPVTKNIVLRPTTYVLSISPEYEEVLSNYDNFLKAMKILGLTK